MFQIQKYNTNDHSERTLLASVLSVEEANAFIASQPLLESPYASAVVPVDHAWYFKETSVESIAKRETVSPKYVPDGQQTEPMLLENEPVSFAQIMQHELKMSQAARIAEHELQLRQQVVMQRLLSGEAS